MVKTNAARVVKAMGLAFAVICAGWVLTDMGG